MTFFNVRGWQRFQHYKDRNPPWIKLHFALLSSEDWVTLDDASRVLAIACMLIASRNEGRVPVNPEYIKRVAYLNKTPNFKPLIECGFLELASECKQVLATAINSLALKTETETETEPASKPANGFHEERKSGKPKAGKRAPEGFKPDLEFASVIAPDMDADYEAQRFLDYEFRSPRSDWPAAWRSWVRKSVADGRYRKRPTTGAIQWQ